MAINSWNARIGEMILTKEKPKYGWYAGGFILIFFPLGLIGVILTVISFLFEFPLNILSVTIGIALILLFLWPAIGMSLLNIILTKQVSIIPKMTIIRNIENPQILDIGCGTGRTAIRIAKELTEEGHLFGIDIYEKLAISGNALDTVRKNAIIESVDGKTTFQYGSAIEIPFEDDTFDIVNISSVLHEIHGKEDQIEAMKEIHRVLKPSGYLYLSEWDRFSFQTIAFAGIFCFVFNTRDHWLNLLNEFGFSNIQYEKVINGFNLFTARKNNGSQAIKSNDNFV